MGVTGADNGFFIGRDGTGFVPVSLEACVSKLKNELGIGTG